MSTKIYGNKGIESFAGLSKKGKLFNYECKLNEKSKTLEKITLNKEWLIKILERIEGGQVVLKIKKKRNVKERAMLIEGYKDLGVLAEIFS